MIYLVFVCLCVNLVSANPLAQLLLQRSNCNQNGCNTYNLPLQSNNQPYVPPIMTQNPMTPCSNSQQFGPQNRLPVQITLDDANQSYLNKVLSNPMLQNILNRNNNNCNQNNKNIAVQENPVQTPNIVNNYYIIPPESLQGNDDAVEFVKKLIGNQEVVCLNDESLNQRNIENERRSVQNSHNRPNEENQRSRGNKRPSNQDNDSARHQNNNNTQKRKRKHGNQNQHGNNQGKQRNNNHDQNINKNVNNKRMETVKIKDERNIPRKQNGTEESEPRDKGNRKRKRPKNKTENQTIDNVQHNNVTIDDGSTTESNDVKIKPVQKEIKKQPEVSASNKDEEVIRDINKKFPGIPEDVIRRLLRYLRRQLKNQPSDSNTESNGISHLPKRNCRRRKINQRKHNTCKKSKITTDLEDVTESGLAVVTDNSLLTSTIMQKKETLRNQVETITKFNNEQENTTEQKLETTPKVLETTTDVDSQTPKLGEEDKILDLENDVYDYFPDFRFDKMYMSEDDYIRSLRDNRFYYTTDRNNDLVKNTQKEDSSEIYYEPYQPTGRKSHNYELQSHEVEDTLARPGNDNFDDNYDEPVLKKYSGKDFEFQTPPSLEFPDFETKPIMKYFDVEGPVYFKPEYKKVDVNDKLSNYSDVKSESSSLKSKPKSGSIETVFGNSKVATYGRPRELEEENLFSKISMNEKSQHDDTFLVYAKSYADS